jgi:hypothetical protein
MTSVACWREIQLDRNKHDQQFPRQILIDSVRAIVCAFSHSVCIVYVYLTCDLHQVLVFLVDGEYRGRERKRERVWA